VSREDYGREEPTSQHHTCMEGRQSRRLEISSNGKAELWVGTTRSSVVGFHGRGFDTSGCFLLGQPSSRLSGCCRFGLGLLKPGRLPGGGHFRLLGRLRDRLGKGIWIWWWSGFLSERSTLTLFRGLNQIHMQSKECHTHTHTHTNRL
jgi:hypothetical protein